LTAQIKNIQAIFFDLDETLIDAQLGVKSAHLAVAEKLQKYFSGKKIKVSGKSLIAHIQKLDDEMNIKTDYNRDKWWPILLKRIGLKKMINLKIIKNLTKTYWSAYIKASTPYKDVKSTLEYLKDKGYRLGIITDTDGVPSWKRRRIKKFRFYKFFDLIVIAGEDTAETKPSPEPFKFAMKKLHTLPEKCIMIGDKPFTDIKGAKAAGMKTVLLKRRDWGINEPADYTINSLSEICRLL
jgi:putative hydrolase of the HAD superfamily